MVKKTVLHTLILGELRIEPAAYGKQPVVHDFSDSGLSKETLEALEASGSIGTPEGDASDYRSAKVQTAEKLNTGGENPESIGDVAEDEEQPVKTEKPKAPATTSAKTAAKDKAAAAKADEDDEEDL